MLLIQGEKWIPDCLVEEILEKLVSRDVDKNRILVFLNWFEDIEVAAKTCADIQKFTGVKYRLGQPGIKW